MYLLLRTKLSISHKSFLWQWKVKAVIVFSPKSPVKSLIFHLQEYFQGVTLRFLTWPILLFFATVVKKFETKGGKGGEEFFHKFVLQKKWKNRSSENGDIVPFLVQQGRSVWKKPLAIFYKLVKSVLPCLGRKGVRLRPSFSEEVFTYALLMTLQVFLYVLWPLFTDFQDH